MANYKVGDRIRVFEVVKSPYLSQKASEGKHLAEYKGHYFGIKNGAELVGLMFRSHLIKNSDIKQVCTMVITKLK